MAEIPANLPWIPSFNTWLDAMHSGAGLGIQRRGQDIQAAEAAARLQQQQHQMIQNAIEMREKSRLGWAQLGMDRELSLARLKQAAATQEASLALREASLDSLTNYRQLEAQNQAARLEQSQRAGAEREFMAGQNLELRRYMAEGTESRAAARLKAEQEYHQTLDARQRTEYQINQLTKEQAGDPYSFLAGAPQPTDPTKLAHWKRVNDRAKQIDSLTQQLQTGGGAVGFGGGPGGGAGGGTIEFVRDPKTGVPVPRGTTTTGTAPATPGAALAPGAGSNWSFSGMNAPAAFGAVQTPSSFLTGAPSPGAADQTDVLPPGGMTTGPGASLTGMATPPFAGITPPASPLDRPSGGFVYGGIGTAPAPRRFDTDEGGGFSFQGFQRGMFAPTMTPRQWQEQELMDYLRSSESQMPPTYK